MSKPPPKPPADGAPCEQGAPSQPGEPRPPEAEDTDLSTLSLSAAVSPFGVIGGVESGEPSPSEPKVAPVDPAAAERAEDDRLIERSLAGDGDAFGGLVSRYQDRLRASLTRLCGSAEEAEDAAQEAFVQAYLKLSSFQRTARFYTWLYRIAFNQAISKNRKWRPRVSLAVVQEAGGVEPESDAETPAEPTLRSERAAILNEAIAQLADDHRQVLVLREFEEMDYQQIAEVIGAPVGTVRSRLFRARMQLKERLEGRLGDDPE